MAETMRGGTSRSLLVPFAAAADDHQRKNAEVLVAGRGGGDAATDDVTPETLQAALLGLLADEARRTAMAARAKALARPGALERIAGMVLRLAKKS